MLNRVDFWDGCNSGQIRGGSAVVTALPGGASRNSQKFESPWRLPLPMEPRLSSGEPLLFVATASQKCTCPAPGFHRGLLRDSCRRSSGGNCHRPSSAPGAAPEAHVASGGTIGTFFLSFFIRSRVSTFKETYERRPALRVPH